MRRCQRQPKHSQGCQRDCSPRKKQTRPESKLNPVGSGRHPQSPEDAIGTENLCRFSVNCGCPARVMDLVQKDIAVLAQPGVEADPIGRDVEIMERKLFACSGPGSRKAYEPQREHIDTHIPACVNKIWLGPGTISNSPKLNRASGFAGPVPAPGQLDGIRYLLAIAPRYFSSQAGVGIRRRILQQQQITAGMPGPATSKRIQFPFPLQ